MDAPAVEEPVTVTLFSQRDPRWGKDRLGISSLTLEQAGCLVSAMASVLCDLEVATDPGQLNAWLTKTQGYVGGNRFMFNAVADLGISCLKVVFCPYTPAPITTLLELFQEVDTYGIVAQVDFRPGGPVTQHWVRLLSLEQVMDPWQLPGQELQPLARYLAAGWNAARGIFAVAWYVRSIAARQRAISPAALRWMQPSITIRPPDLNSKADPL